MQYIIRDKNDPESFVSYVGYIAGWIPTISRMGTIDECTVLRKRDLHIKMHEDVDKTRKELIEEKYPHLEFVAVKFKIMEVI